ncbi:hypothetical protein R1sor_017500 [Riccia sorocarpa]|uniref:Uncharacterized protein n=1 Tax=Riccia sorocarpa TaxID=122646 RepID=A0ABD3I718_9MARC
MLELTPKNLMEIYILIDKVIKSQPNYKLLEREAIKGALKAWVFGVIPKDVVHYLLHPEVATKTPALAAAVVEEESQDEKVDIAEDMRKFKKHEVEHWATA